jgi:pimeloyl-ACP methyl ester carboxylesterase
LDATPVLLVHGVIERGAFWGPVATRLADAGFDVVCVDQRGHGDSQRGTAPFSAATLGGDLAAWIEQLDLSDVVVVGHSMGAVSTMAYAIESCRDGAPRPKAAVLIGAGPPRPTPQLLGSLVLLLTHPALVRRPTIGLMLMSLLAAGPRPTRPTLEAMRSAFLAMDRETFAQSNRTVSDLDLADDLRSVTIPVHVLAERRGPDDLGISAQGPGQPHPRSDARGDRRLRPNAMFDAPDDVASALGKVAAGHLPLPT